MDQLTPAQKAAQTRAERAERKNAKNAAIKNDSIRAIEICREIRDNPAAAPSDRLEAIRLLHNLIA